MPASPSVFISHRGLQMKKGFANQLYHALTESGIDVFLDIEKGFSPGQDVREPMVTAARNASIGVPIFTVDYGSSQWCLKELVAMMECHQNGAGKVIPVFFGVTSVELRKEEGPFAKKNLGKSPETCDTGEGDIQRWKTALEDASWLKGFWLETYGGREGALLQELVRQIRQEIFGGVPVNMGRDKVGLEPKVQHVVELLNLSDTARVFVLLVHGMGGVGKTTLAEAVYYSQERNFEGASFIKDCRAMKAIEAQDQLRKTLLRDSSDIGGDLRRGRACLETGLRKKKVLIVLDDVEDYFVSVQDVIDLARLGLGSRVVVTSRDQRVFSRLNMSSGTDFQCRLYGLEPMVGRVAWDLFCSHAFAASHADPAFEELAREVVEACAGIPLALEVLGRLLRTSDCKAVWKEAIIKLRNNEHKDISDRLMVSYGALDDEEQKMFQDVACVLIGESEDDAKYFWNDLDGCESGLQKLKDLCVVKVDEKNRLAMHDLLRDLGRHESRKTRLWKDDDLQQLIQDQQGLDQVRAIATSVPSLETHELSKMTSLRLLFLRETQLEGGQMLKIGGQRRPKIRWLKLLRCTDNKRIHEDLSLEFLAVLHLQSVDVAQMPPSFWRLKKLQRLVMDTCTNSEELPADFSGLESLEEFEALDLGWMFQLPASFGRLRKLRRLVMHGCYKLVDLSADFGDLESLEEFKASGLSSMVQLPPSFGRLRKLCRLVMDRCDELVDLSTNFGDLESLEEFKALGLRSMVQLPPSFGRLRKLQRLVMGQCDELVVLPADFGDLESLEEFKTVDLGLMVELPASFGRLRKLRRL